MCMADHYNSLPFRQKGGAAKRKISKCRNFQMKTKNSAANSSQFLRLKIALPVCSSSGNRTRFSEIRTKRLGRLPIRREERRMESTRSVSVALASPAVFHGVRFFVDPSLVPCSKHLVTDMLVVFGGRREESFPGCASHLVTDKTACSPDMVRRATSLHLDVVDVDWVFSSLKKGSLLPAPSLFPLFQGMVVAITNVSSGEMLPLSELLDENGATQTHRIDIDTTHLVTPVAHGPMFEEALHRSSIKVVTPKWVRECATRKRRLLEEKYVPSPLGIAVASPPPLIFEGIGFWLCGGWETTTSRDELVGLVRSHGAAVRAWTGSGPPPDEVCAGSDAMWLCCYGKSHTCSRPQTMRLVSTEWVHASVARGVLLPVSHRGGVPGFEKVEVCTTGYITGDPRDLERVRHLCAVAGCGFNNSLSSHRTTHLIATLPIPSNSKKLAAARQYSSIHVVTEAWLSECVAQWCTLPESAYPFTEALTPASSATSDIHCIPPPAEEANSTHRSHALTETLPESPEHSSGPPQNESEDQRVDGHRMDVPPTLLLQHDEENHSPSSPLHATHLTTPKRDQPTETRQHKRRLEVSAAPAHSKQTQSKQANKRTKVCRPSTHRVMVCGPKPERHRLETLCRKLGATVISGDGYSNDVTHLIMPQLKRTTKFLCACAAGKWIVRPRWIEASFQHGGWVDEEAHEIFSPEVIKFGQVGLLWAGAARRARLSSSLAFESLRVLIHSPPQSFAENCAEFRVFLESGGAQVVTLAQANADPSCVTHCAVSQRGKHRSLLETLRKQGVRIVDGSIFIDFVCAKDPVPLW